MSFFEGTDLWTLAVIAGLTGVTIVTRSFFFFSSEEWALPDWAQRGLQYAPIAAMAAVVLPEILLQQGQFLQTWMDARCNRRKNMTHPLFSRAIRWLIHKY